MIPLEPTDEERSLVEGAKAFRLKAIEPLRVELDREGRFPRALMERAHEAGFLTSWLPESLGGGGLDPVRQMGIVEEIARGDAGVATSMFVGFLAACPLLTFGTDRQRQRWLAPMAARPVFASFAWTEPDGSTSLLFRHGGTIARRDGRGWVLRGQKAFITNAPVADWMVVFARDAESRSLCAFVVPRSADGVSVTEPYRKMGQRASSTGDVFLDDVRVPDEDRVGAVGEGAAIALDAMSRSRVGVGAMAVGVARAARERVVAYGRDRRTGGGQPLVARQDYRFRLAEIDVAIETSRLLVRKAAAAMARDDPERTRWASMAKLEAARAAVRVTGEAVEMLGGTGYTEEGGVEKLMRDAKLLEIYEGPAAIQKTLLAEWAVRGDG